MTDKLTDADYAALAEFRFALRKFLSFSEREAARHGLTPQQHQALLVIRAACDRATVGHIAERLILRPHSATGLIDRLVALDMVQRKPSPGDKRQALLVLTRSADDLLDQLSIVHRDEIRRIVPLLNSLLNGLTAAVD
ncbi:MAG: MarR family transcriptional regulator [Sphingomonadales bacterium]|nr:MarR family transcriptional regulator [Sphingomonadales bacterium]